jgi:dihydrofolate reductase
MRSVIYGAACSLDGFIAGPNGEIDWLHFSQDVRDIMSEFWTRIDTVIMGRKTWDVAATQSGGTSPYAGVASYVFSRTLIADPHPDVRLVREDAGRFVRSLKRKRGKDICVMGGGDFARSLLEADVIDAIGLNVHPVLLGSGVPLFLDAGRRVALTLDEARQLDGGCMLLNYRVRR